MVDVSSRDDSDQRADWRMIVSVPFCIIGLGLIGAVYYGDALKRKLLRDKRRFIRS